MGRRVLGQPGESPALREQPAAAPRSVARRRRPLWRRPAAALAAVAATVTAGQLVLMSTESARAELVTDGVLSVSPGRAAAVDSNLPFTDGTGTVTFNLPRAAADNLYFGVQVRSVGQSAYLTKVRVLADGRVTLGLSRVGAGTEDRFGTVELAGLRTSVPAQVKVETKITGTSDVRIMTRAWLAGGVKPTTWSLTATDLSPQRLTATGTMRAWGYLSTRAKTGIALQFTNLVSPDAPKPGTTTTTRPPATTTSQPAPTTSSTTRSSTSATTPVTSTPTTTPPADPATTTTVPGAPVGTTSTSTTDASTPPPTTTAWTVKKPAPITRQPSTTAPTTAAPTTTAPSTTKPVVTTSSSTPAATSSSAATGSDAGPATTGVPSGTALTVHQGDLVVTTDGATFDGLDIHGFVDIRAANVKITRSLIRGGVATGNRGVVTVTHSDASGFVLEDSEIRPDHPSVLLDGIIGGNYTLRRVEIDGGVDAAKIFKDNARIEKSWLHGTDWFASDANQNGGPTHNDGVQILGGTNPTLLGNRIEGAENAGIMVSQNVSAVRNLTIKGNRLSGGACTVNIVPNNLQSIGPIYLQDNTFGNDSTVSGCAVARTASTDLVSSGNIYLGSTTAAKVNVWN